MIRIIGNSPQRIIISDMKDTIYYRQQKQYTDEEFANSKDLQKKIRQGLITVIEEIKADRPSIEKSLNNSGECPDSFEVLLKDIISGNDASIKEIRNLIKELKETKFIEGIRDIIREELRRVSFSAPKSVESSSEVFFDGPEYIPDIVTDGLVSNIKIEEREISSNDVSSASDMLRKLRKQIK